MSVFEEIKWVFMSRNELQREYAKAIADYENRKRIANSANYLAGPDWFERGVVNREEERAFQRVKDLRQMLKSRQT